jgi:hypothetical protein
MNQGIHKGRLVLYIEHNFFYKYKKAKYVKSLNILYIFQLQHKVSNIMSILFEKTKNNKFFYFSFFLFFYKEMKFTQTILI